eukprot:5920426-Prymnesium_polylepis.2
MTRACRVARLECATISELHISMSSSSMPPLALTLNVAWTRFPEGSHAVPTGAESSSSTESGRLAMICGDRDRNTLSWP